TVIDNALKLAAPNSYDQAYLLDSKARIFAGNELYTQAIQPWEEVIRISEEYGYFEEKQRTMTLLFVAQFIYVESVNIKDKAQQNQQVSKAAGYLKRYLAREKSPTLETRMLYAQILYFQATSEPKAVNQDLLKEARHVVEEALLTSIRPKESTYTFLLAILQQQNEVERSTELLELILSQYPTKKDFWPALTGSYLQLANTNEKNESKAREYQIRAINSTERAQALGFMKTPSDNWRLVSMYLLAGQFTKGTELLHAGLRNGSIESTTTYWKYLGDYYRQAHKELEAVNALDEAAKLFPKDGSFHLQVGEIYRGMERTKDARDQYRLAVKKGNLDKPWNAYQLLAFAAMEMDDWDEALLAITKASEFPESNKDPQMVRLKEHIEKTAKDRKTAEEEKKQGAKAPSPKM
ncbi:MAG: hypothetical protein ABIZ49_07020, partial [Opitutaceae bacterium]